MARELTPGGLLLASFMQATVLRRSGDGGTGREAASKTSRQGLRTSGEGALRRRQEGDRELPHAGQGPRHQRKAALPQAAQGRQPVQRRVRSNQPQGGQGPEEEEEKEGGRLAGLGRCEPTSSSCRRLPWCRPSASSRRFSSQVPCRAFPSPRAIGR